MEMFDICNEQGQPTGAIVSRTKAHEEGILHRTAHIWVVRKNDSAFGYDVLLQKRSMKKDSFPGCLDTSSAGHIQAGDQPLESALRELEEELGIRTSGDKLKFMGNFRIQYQEEFHGKLFKDNEVVFAYLYDQPIGPDEIVVQEEELDGAYWFDLKETLQKVQEEDDLYCIPPKGIETLKDYLNMINSN